MGNNKRVIEHTNGRFKTTLRFAGWPVGWFVGLNEGFNGARNSATRG